MKMYHVLIRKSTPTHRSTPTKKISILSPNFEDITEYFAKAFNKKVLKDGTINVLLSTYEIKDIVNFEVELMEEQNYYIEVEYLNTNYDVKFWKLIEQGYRLDQDGDLVLGNVKYRLENRKIRRV